MRNFPRPLTALRIAASTGALAACAGGSGNDDVDTSYVARDVSTLYKAGKTRLDRGQFDMAAALLDAVERQHPYALWARWAQLMRASRTYMGRDYTKGIGTARSVLYPHPGQTTTPPTPY